MAAVLPEGHPCASLSVIPLEKLCHEKFIQLDEGVSSTPLDVYEKHHLALNVAYKVYDDYTILAMIRQGMGVSILYRLVISGFDQGLVIRPLSEEIGRTVCLACRDYETMPAAARAFYAYIQKEAAQIVKRTLSF
jgi:DNA-binding transcriptional LysR family regulator